MGVTFFPSLWCSKVQLLFKLWRASDSNLKHYVVHKNIKRNRRSCSPGFHSFVCAAVPTSARYVQTVLLHAHCVGDHLRHQQQPPGRDCAWSLCSDSHGPSDSSYAPHTWPGFPRPESSLAGAARVLRSHEEDAATTLHRGEVTRTAWAVTGKGFRPTFMMSWAQP